jgi:hypothetical protein
VASGQIQSIEELVALEAYAEQYFIHTGAVCVTAVNGGDGLASG